MLHEQMPEAANDQGEYRELRPDEIASAVRTWRNRLGWKQITLAHEANVTERTIQRIECGESVSADSLERVSKALGLTAAAFVGPRYVPSRAEAERVAAEHLAEWEKNWALVEIHVLDDQRFFEAVMVAHAFHIDDHDMESEAEDLIAELRDLLADWSNIYNEVSATERLKARRDLVEHVRKVEQLGYTARYGTYDAAFGSAGVTLKVAVILFIKQTDTDKVAMKKMMVPRQHAAL